MPLSIRPMQWSTLPALHDTPPLDETDIDCLREIRDVLARHGKLQRFAVHLAHRHFELGPDEVLIERPDPTGGPSTLGSATWPTNRWPARPHGCSRMTTASFTFLTRSIASASPPRTAKPASATAKPDPPAPLRRERKPCGNGGFPRRRAGMNADSPSAGTTSGTRGGSGKAVLFPSMKSVHEQSGGGGTKLGIIGYYWVWNRIWRLSCDEGAEPHARAGPRKAHRRNR